jgi:segregation and condensation protein B
MVSSSDRDPREENAAADLGLDQFEAISDEPGISLDELSEAYAQLMGKGSDPYELHDEQPPAEATPAEAIVQQQPPSEEEVCDICPRSIVEAILFVGHPTNEALPGPQIASLMRGVPEREIAELVQELNEIYDSEGHPFHVISEGAGYRMVLRDEFASLRDSFYGRVREARLSQAAIDVLAVVAYHQGLTREKIDQMLGKPSGGLLSQLVRRQLLRLERPETKPRRPRYYTTDRFLRLFGLAGIDELPRSQDLERG